MTKSAKPNDPEPANPQNTTSAPPVKSEKKKVRLAVSLPYLASPGSIKNALERVRAAATPERVTGDFVTTKLGIKGGTGAAIVPLLKKLGFVNADGTPSDIYKRFRNATASVSGAAMAEAIRRGYAQLADANEYFFDLNDKDLKSLIVQVTGGEAESSAVKQIHATLGLLKQFAVFENSLSEPGNQAPAPKPETELSRIPPDFIGRESASVGMNLSYTINLNLPATPDQAVFNAIFKSLREHLIV